MLTLSIISAIILSSYLIITAIKFGLPDMISDTYYQLNKKGWIFSSVMLFTAISMLISILDTNQGIQCLAFLGCAGLAFVGCAPNYLVDYRVHKTAAIIASIGCIGWSFSVNYIITLSILGAYLIYLLFIYLHINVQNKSRQEIPKAHPWYFLELAGFVDVYLTYFLI